ncbi:MAG: hypothetical protein EAX91_03515 [Candidatus Lokiarchaeota archaeon]|nr:hypothetical protein [Candidatus Lokiarchaeota archaeon]
MAILEQNVHPQITELNEYSCVKITCPICKVSKDLKFPKSVINEAKQLTTISLPKGLVCDHHFQAFVDKNFSVRGYQKVDFEFETQKSVESRVDLKLLKENEDELFENLIFEGNYVEYKPKHKSNRGSHPTPEYTEQNAGKRSLKDIYDEFWEFIDDRNPKFKEFIEKDNRRILLKVRVN